MNIRGLRSDETEPWLAFRERLWPDFSRAELADEQVRLILDPHRFAVFVAESDDGTLAGLVEVSIREWAEGCKSHPVGYLEAWYVNSDQRRRGIGKGLLQAAERWAASRGCVEMASDADIDNQVSHRAHASMGYVEVGRAVLFSKVLVDSDPARRE